LTALRLNKKQRMVKLKLVLEEMCEYSGPDEVEISDEKFRDLSRLLGIYGFGWYFVSPTTIKYFNGKSWHYKDLGGCLNRE